MRGGGRQALLAGERRRGSADNSDKGVCRCIRSDATAALSCVVNDITMRVLAELVLSALFRLSDLLAPSLSV